IMPKLVAESKMVAPGSRVMVCLPALMRSGSSSPPYGQGPMPITPFSDCSVTFTPGGRLLATRAGMPMPRSTESPSFSSASATAATSSGVHAASGPRLRIGVPGRGAGVHGGLLDALLGGGLEPMVPGPAGGVAVAGAEPAGLHEVLRLGEGRASALGRRR